MFFFCFVLDMVHKEIWTCSMVILLCYLKYLDQVQSLYSTMVLKHNFLRNEKVWKPFFVSWSLSEIHFNFCHRMKFSTVSCIIKRSCFVSLSFLLCRQDSSLSMAFCLWVNSCVSAVLLCFAISRMSLLWPQHTTVNI